MFRDVNKSKSNSARPANTSRDRSRGGSSRSGGNRSGGQGRSYSNNQRSEGSSTGGSTGGGHSGGFRKPHYRDNRSGGNSGGRSRFGGGSRPQHRSQGPRLKGRDRIEAVSAAEIERFISQHSKPETQQVEVETQPEVKHTFADFKLGESITRNITKKGYTIPTPIQDQAIPVIMEGKDVVGIANTGTGKSAAFLLPLLYHIERDHMAGAIIIAPTRELAVQLDEELQSFMRGSHVQSCLVIGGANIERQIRDLRRRHEFVIGTPGRIKDLVQRGELQLERYSAFVLDEVDRMLDMGFINDVRFLVQKLPEKRQSLFFSATMTPQIEEIMRQFVKSYEKIQVKTSETNRNITQEIIYIQPGEKQRKLEQIINDPTHGLTRSIVFVRTKHGADKLARMLRQSRYKVEALHGDKRQSQRQRIMKDFKTGRVDLLIATDVAARGLDINDVSHVINYDLPNSLADYVHRIGRTGRAAKTGVALTFIEKK